MKNDQWYYLDREHQTLGAYSSEELMEFYKRKIITDKSYVWKNGFDDWKRLEDVHSSIFPIELEISIAKNTPQQYTRDYKESTDQILDHSLLSINSKPSSHNDYATPYSVVWLSDQHKQNVVNLTEKLVQNIALQRRLENFRLSPTKPDGLIIGTGEADFTKGNVPYEFNYRDKVFQLIDVPGIEGNEAKYEPLVKQAIEKAHLVIYVNGTNKKPEEVTTRKIKSYINQYAKIYAICNVRGKADSYEFEDDQVSLEKTHTEINNVLDQTLSVLNQNVGQDLIEGGQCIQGLLAFSALAFDQENNETTMSYSRKDLIKTQKSYMRDFSSLEKMKSFSQINVLEQKIISKFSTFEQDIVESNKRKIVRKIEEVIAVIQEQLKIHLELQNKIKKEIDVGKDSISRTLVDFENNLLNKSNNAISFAFSTIAEDGCVAIEDKFGEQDIISSTIKNIVDHESRNLSKRLDEIKAEVSLKFSNNLTEVIQRIGRNIEQVQINFDLEHSRNLKFSINFSNTSIFDAKSMGKGLIEIGGMAALGASIGTVFPVLGNIVGGLIGGVLGLVKAIIGIFSSRQSKINKAQSQFRTNVNSAQSNFKSQVKDSVHQMLCSVREETNRNLITKINSEYEKMQDIESILSTQIKKLSNLNNQIKSKNYGTI